LIIPCKVFFYQGFIGFIGNTKTRHNNALERTDGRSQCDAEVICRRSAKPLARFVQHGLQPESVQGVEQWHTNKINKTRATKPTTYFNMVSMNTILSSKWAITFLLPNHCLS
jgi:hypothetical protein